MKIAAFLLAALHVVLSGASGMQTGCDIAQSLHGDYYTIDLTPFSQVTISATKIQLRTSEYEEEFKSLDYSCQKIISFNTTGERIMFVHLKLIDVDTDTSTCITIEVMDEANNVLKWKEASDVYCDNLSRYRGHNPSVADGDFLFRKDMRPSPCPPLLFNTSLPFRYEMDVLRKGRQVCSNDVNQFQSDDTGNLELLWQQCPDVIDLYYPAVNKTFMCLGSWSDNSGSTFLIADKDADNDMNKFRCMWISDNNSDGYVNLEMGLATDECSMYKEHRRKHATFVVEDMTSSAAYIAGALLLISALLSFIFTL